MPQHRIRNVLAAAALAALPSFALAADRTVGAGGEFATIQAAAAAAAPGDRIVIARGVYRENVHVATSDLTIVGAPGAILDGTTGPDLSNVCMIIEADRVVVRDLTFRAGTDQIRGVGSGIEVRNCTFRRARERAVALESADLVVDGCTFRGSRGTAIETRGFRSTISNNRILGSASAINTGGDLPAITGNTIRRANGFVVIWVHDAPGGSRIEGNDIAQSGYLGIYVEADHGVVASNDLRAISGEVIAVIGSDARIDGNDIRVCRGSAVLAFGDRTQIVSNVVTRVVSRSVAILASDMGGGGVSISGNTLSDCADSGIQANTGGISIVGNTVTRCGAGSETAGILISGGGGVTVEDCTVTDCGFDGIRIDVPDCVVRRCTVTGSVFAGFYVRGAGAFLEACEATGSTAGVFNDSNPTVLFGGTFTGNRYDLCVTFRGGWGGVTNVTSATGGLTTRFEHP